MVLSQSLSIVPCSLRSRVFGSPQCRSRAYILGGRGDLLDVADFRAMVQFFTETAPSLHVKATVHDILRWTQQLNPECDRILQLLTLTMLALGSS